MGSIAGSFLAQEFTFDLLFNNGCVSFTTRHELISTLTSPSGVIIPSVECFRRKDSYAESVVRGLGANNYHAEFGTNVLGPFFLAEILVRFQTP
jgi:hypothetical protein